MLYRIGHARDEPAPANGYHNSFHIAHLLQSLKADGALPGDHLVVVERVDEGCACFLLAAHGSFICIIIGALDKADFRPKALGGFHLADGSAVRHEDHALRALARCGKSHALRMVAGAAGDDARALLLLGELADFVISAAQLKAAGYLEVLRF